MAAHRSGRLPPCQRGGRRGFRLGVGRCSATTGGDSRGRCGGPRHPGHQGYTPFHLTLLSRIMGPCGPGVSDLSPHPTRTHRSPPGVWRTMRPPRRSPFVVTLVLAALLAGGTATVATQAAARLAYPETKRVDVADDLHGKSVPDPYRWLEQDPRTSPEVAQWIDAENAVSRTWLEQVPEREELRKRLEALWNYERFTAPALEGGRVFYTRNTGLQNQSVVYTMGAAGAEGPKVIDPNEWAKDGTIALTGYSASDDGR